MSVTYQAVGWNAEKRVYDSVLAALVLSYLAVFTGAGAWLQPNATIETLLIRGLGTLALLLLHVVLAIGPLCRLDTRFLPLLYNRRHLGVTMFFVALAHGLFSLIQFHAFGDVPILESLFTSNQDYASLRGFPFEVPGFAALLWLFLMAATSHDFWLETLSPRIWKMLHMGVYGVYTLLVAHVVLGVLQQETHPALLAVLATGVVTLVALHLAAASKERAQDRVSPVALPVESIPENRARIVTLGGERIAVFRYEGKISALSNVCRHQNGPLGEGRIIDGCVTCPWHGYQYRPDSGASPPPFPEKVAPYRTRVVDGVVYVDPRPCAPGIFVEPSRI